MDPEVPDNVPLTENQKNAYRFLLYMAMLDIRPMQWTMTKLRYVRPRRWRQLVDESKTNGALACWLHNLAHFASFDFERFDEAAFWTDGQWLARRNVELFERYKSHYVHRLWELDSGERASTTLFDMD